MNFSSTHRSSHILVALAFCMALQMTGFVMILPLFARRFESFGAGVAALGVSAMAYALTSTIAAPFIGTLADRFGRRPIIIFSLAAYGLAFTGYLLATTSWMLILFRGLAGVFTAGLIPAVMSSVGDLAPENRRGQWIGIVNGGASAGWIVGPVLGGLLYDRFDYVVPFATSVIMARNMQKSHLNVISRVRSENMLQFQIPIESPKSPCWSTHFHGLVLGFTTVFHAYFSPSNRSYVRFRQRLGNHDLALPAWYR